ncbi:osteopetrosis-associated transmembrane protein 1 isoform X2 [Hetaerina americana]|uniref:osteopetrosis-associated transmembrane protein 1 isoform X2 n=1 Tax=Hetaerina americana TaxID=62018 RepID=UPI003A7F115C
MEFSILNGIRSILWTFILMIPFFHGPSASFTDLINDKNKTCDKLQSKFAFAAQDFISCSIVNARPITFCEGCVTSYLDVLSVHQEISTGSENGTHCRNELINVDRLEIIETLYNNIDSLWTRGECNHCFEVNTNGSTTSKLNNSTKTFQTLNSVVRKCVIDNMPRDKPDICEICHDSYEKLNEFYNELKHSENPSHICMDIVDSATSGSQEDFTQKINQIG